MLHVFSKLHGLIDFPSLGQYFSAACEKQIQIEGKGEVDDLFLGPDEYVWDPVGKTYTTNFRSVLLPQPIFPPSLPHT